MKNARYYFVLVVFTIAIVSIAYSQTRQRTQLQKPINWEFGASLGYTTASSFYNLNDSLISSLTEEIGDTSRRYTFDFYHTLFTIQARYYFDENFKMFLNVPISFFELEEKYSRNDYGYREGKKNYTLNRIDNVELGISKQWTIGSIKTGVASSVKIPTGFHNGLYDDPNYEFLSDRALEWHLETELDLQVKQYSFENNVAFDLRGEEFENQIIWNAGIGIQTIPNTELKLFTEIILSTAKYTSETRPLIPHQEVSQEDNYYAGTQLTLLFSREIYTKFGYQVSLYGKNSWKKGMAYFQILYRI